LKNEYAICVVDCKRVSIIYIIKLSEQVNEINSQTLEKNIKKTVRVVYLNKCKCCHPKLGAHQTSN